MNGMRLLITGGSSYLGRYLTRLAVADFEVCYTYFQNDPLGLPQGEWLDVREETAVSRLVHTFRPHVIIHTIGSNRCDDMYNVICRGTAHVTHAARATNARLIHISTDALFDGRHAPYTESASPSPLHEYGRAKAAAETIVSQHPDHVIIRTSLIYGLHEMDHSTAWIARALQAGKPVVLFDNQRRNPVWVETLARACLELATTPYVGILNVAGRQVLTRAEFGLRLLDWWQIAARETLQIGKADGEKWPLDCELDLQRATAVLQTPLYGVDEVLQRFTPPECTRKTADS